MNESGADAVSDDEPKRPRLEVETADTTPRALVWRRPESALVIAKLVVVAFVLESDGKVETLEEVAVKNCAATSPCTLSFCAGAVLPIPRLPLVM